MNVSRLDFFNQILARKKCPSVVKDEFEEYSIVYFGGKIIISSFLCFGTPFLTFTNSTVSGPGIPPKYRILYRPIRCDTQRNLIRQSQFQPRHELRSSKLGFVGKMWLAFKTDCLNVVLKNIYPIYDIYIYNIYISLKLYKGTCWYKKGYFP